MLGMNPGPFGMAQTGVPFGEVAAVRDWMGLDPRIGKPEREHPKRKITGMECPKSEVSGRRLWGYFSEVFPKAEDFFRDHLVINFCPLIWMKDTGANVTPDKIKAVEIAPVDEACQRHLRNLIEILEPGHLIGVGAYAEKQMEEARKTLGLDVKVGKILHPSPASPVANRGWAAAAEKQLGELGICGFGVFSGRFVSGTGGFGILASGFGVFSGGFVSGTGGFGILASGFGVFSGWFVSGTGGFGVLPGRFSVLSGGHGVVLETFVFR
eukprot:g3780.t1